MGIPVVLSPRGIPVRQVASGAPVMTVAANGLGIPVRVTTGLGAPFVIQGGTPTPTSLVANPGGSSSTTVGNVSGAQTYDVGSPEQFIEGKGGPLLLKLNISPDGLDFYQLSGGAYGGDPGINLTRWTGGVEVGNVINYTGVPTINSSDLRRVSVEKSGANYVAKIYINGVVAATSGTLVDARYNKVGTAATTSANTVKYGGTVAPLAFTGSYSPFTGKYTADLTYFASGAANVSATVNGSAATVTIVNNPAPGTARVDATFPGGVQGTQVTLVITTKLVSDNSTVGTASTVVDVPVASVAGMNETGITQADVAYLSGYWTAPSSYIEIGAVGQRTDGRILATTDGSGASVKRALDGGIYGLNGLGYTEYRYLVRHKPAPSQYGTWVISFAPGMTATTINSDNITGGSYNSTTGDFTFTVAGEFYVDFGASCASFTATKIIPSVRKSGTTKGDRTNDPVGVANVQALATRVRDMDIVGAIGEGGFQYASTDTFRDGRTTTNHAKGQRFYEIEDIVAMFNATGRKLWHNNRQTDTVNWITYEAAYLAANLTVSDPYIENGNEDFNFGQPQGRLRRLRGVRAGLAPSGLANNAAAVTETIIDCIFQNALTGTDTGTATTTRAYASGDKFMIEAGGCRVYQTSSAKASGSTFPFPAGGSGFTLLYTIDDCDRAMFRLEGNETARNGDIYKAAWAAAGRVDAGPKAVLAYQAAGGLTGGLTALAWENNHLKIDCLASAPYYGEGVGGKFLAIYNDTSIAGYGPAQKDVLYTGTVAAGMAAFLDLYFSISRVAIDATFAVASQNFKDLGDFLVTLGRARNAIKNTFYEIGYHNQFNNGGFPDRADPYNSGQGYSTGNFVKWTDNAVYVALQAVPAATTPANASYWALKLSAAVVAEKRTEQITQALIRDPRHGADYDYYLRGLASAAGGDLMVYLRAGSNLWAIMRDEFDNATSGGSTNYLFKAISDLKTVIG